MSGESTCPAPQAVEAAVLPSSAAALRRHREHVTLSVTGSTLRLQLVDAAAEPVLERTLVTVASCAARAAAAATMVEAMELELYGGAPVVELPALRDEPMPLAITVEAPPTAHASAGLEVGVAVLGALSGDAIEPAVGVTIDVAPALAGLRLRAALFAEGTRSLAFGAGSVGYQRSWLAVGPGYRLRWRRVSFQVGLSATASRLALRGDGTTSLASVTAFEAGAGLDVEARWSLGAWAISGGLFVLSWPASTNIALAVLDESRTLPSWEGLLGAGLEFTAL